MIQTDQIQDILKKINNVSIAVYGDFCLDAYWLMDPDGSEVSVETVRLILLILYLHRNHRLHFHYLAP